MRPNADQTEPKDTDDFYRDLREFDDFSDVTNLSLYSPLPDDWRVVLADIKGSTTAIRDGRYKDVNMIGAACITAVVNAVPDRAIPYAFGGDGATLAIPAAAEAHVRRALGAARGLSRTQFNLDLRAGIVPVGDIREAGADVLVAKFQLSPGNAMAMFAGGGVQLVDSLIKAEDSNERYRVPFPENGAAPDLTGLSCRWEPLRSCQGAMLTMLISARAPGDDEKAETYRAVIERVGGILQANDTGPVSAENMIFKWPSLGIRNEARLLKGSPKRLRKWVRLYLTSFIQFVLEKFNLSFGGYDAPTYRAELRANSDFRRFDDMLRMILDCPITMADEIESYFNELRAQGKIAFGLHRSDQALMTCLVFSLTKGEHVHFIDGADGGYAMAAVQLKAQLQADADAMLGDEP